MTATRGLVVPHRVEPARRPPEPDPWVHRFGATERFAHWWTVSLLTAALLSGLGLGDDGGGPMLAVHVAAVVLLASGLVGVLIFGDRSAVLTVARRLFVLDRRDREWLAEVARRPLARRQPPDWGMFNAAQKLLSWALLVCVSVVIGTGVQSWASGGEGGLHGAFAVVAVVLIGCHVFMAVVNPSTRPALRGMVRGYVSRSWAATHHARWLRETDEAGGD